MQNVFPENSPIAHQADYDSSLNGLGGWFSLIIIGLLLSLARGIYQIIDVSAHLKFSGSMFFPSLLLTVWLCFEIVGAIVILFFIFKRNIIFRPLFVIQSVVMLLLSITAIVYAESQLYAFSNWTDFGISLAASVGWICYLYSAKRVKNTFIYPNADYSRNNNTFIE